jgi:hypothetical protein
MWMGKKKLYEREPKALDMQTLGKLQTALMGRLMLVNMELQARLRAQADTHGVRGDEKLALSADQLDGFNLMLDHFLLRAEQRTSARTQAA